MRSKVVHLFLKRLASDVMRTMDMADGVQSLFGIVLLIEMKEQKETECEYVSQVGRSCKKQSHEVVSNR